MARSIVSKGTEDSRAFWYMVRSDALVSRSPPPSRAATSTCRINLAKTLARALSLAPLRCWVVAHFEWPDIQFLSYPKRALSLYLRITARRRRGGGSGRRSSVRGERNSPRCARDERAPGVHRRRDRGMPKRRGPRTRFRSSAHE